VQGQQDREFAAMRQGIIDVLCGAPINWSGTIRECGAFAMPFLIPDHKAYDALINSEAVTKDFFDVIRKNGAEPLAVGETGYRQLSNSKRAVRKPEDLKGLKIRIPPSTLYQEILSGMGANPTAMSWADAQPAMASGAVDGQENPMELFQVLKVHTLGQKFVTKWNYSNDILLYAIATPIWNSWSAQDQRIVRECAQEAAKLNIQRVRDIYAKDVELVRALGVDVVVPTPAEMEAWQIACRRPYARWKAQINPGLISKFEEVVARSRKA
jgi:TRAP-type C4-dicarboxylate transport system substrate-binding protein